MIVSMKASFLNFMANLINNFAPFLIFSAIFEGANVAAA